MVRPQLSTDPKILQSVYLKVTEASENRISQNCSPKSFNPNDSISPIYTITDRMFPLNNYVLLCVNAMVLVWLGLGRKRFVVAF